MTLFAGRQHGVKVSALAVWAASAIPLFIFMIVLAHPALCDEEGERIASLVSSANDKLMKGWSCSFESFREDRTMGEYRLSFHDGRQKLTPIGKSAGLLRYDFGLYRIFDRSGQGRSL